MRPHKPVPHAPRRTFLRSGTTLVLGDGERQVRVLTLPRHCGSRLLNRLWDDCFGGEPRDDLVVWWPWDPTNPPPPSAN